MFNINRTLKKGVRYPDKELLCDYQDLHFADLVSTPAVRAMSGIDDTIELGDSGYWYMITFDLSLIGQSRKENLMEFCDKFAQEIEIALPRMSKKYKDFYQYFLEDKKKNGVNFCEIGKELSWFFSLLFCPQNTFKELLCHTNYKEGI